MKENKKKIIILGGGIAGLSAAYFLEQNNIDYKLFEKEKVLGGLCRTIKTKKGFLYDFTGHLLHFSDKNIENLVVKDLLKNNIEIHNRKSYIFIKNRFIDFPFQKNLYNLPEDIKKDCLYGYL
ncbi:MAG: NAD(P)-binding protein, partial [Elusimicrobiota bacterium]|nr:NAD(P)-binding protein [Elusimicrobiota bacterium]